jgi:hypothetical protein
MLTKPDDKQALELMATGWDKVANKCEASESVRQSHDERRTSDGVSVGGRPSMIGGYVHLLTAHIAQALRDAGAGCEIAIPVPTQTAVLRRDRVIIIVALSLLILLAWSYLRWLSADMSMGGMDMNARGRLHL